MTKSVHVHSPGPLLDTQTHDNLRACFQHDAQAAQLSARFARVAEIEGFPEVARAFREMAESQAFQAQGHLDLLMRAVDPLGGGAMGGTTQNLRAAMAAHDEMLDRLPDMVGAARAEGFFDVASWYESLLHASRAHRRRLGELLDGEPKP